MTTKNSAKSDAELAWEFVAQEFNRQELEPSRIIDRISGCESSYMGCPQRN
ncbi:MAG: hypothetical protein PHV74_13890 [Dehalococcoidia bacterium]|nr:hypothetical protein [Dehalococcoidia bacterium]